MDGTSRLELSLAELHWKKKKVALLVIMTKTRKRATSRIQYNTTTLMFWITTSLHMKLSNAISTEIQKCGKQKKKKAVDQATVIEEDL